MPYPASYPLSFLIPAHHLSNIFWAAVSGAAKDIWLPGIPPSYLAA